MPKRCSRCDELRPEDDFMWRRRNLNQRDSYCRTCRAAYKKEHYAKNKKRYLKQARARSDREIPKRIEWIVQYLEEHPCVDCGESDPVVLDFDHRRDKVFDIAHGARYRRWEDVLTELEKCEVRCGNCHRRRTASSRGYGRSLLTNYGG
jgi:hypothetical protein